MKRRFLPKYVSSFRDRNGKMRYRYRKKGAPAGDFHSSPGTEEFRIEYHAFQNQNSGKANDNWTGYQLGTIGHLKHRYMSVPTRLGPTRSPSRRWGLSSKTFVEVGRIGSCHS